MQRYIIRTGQFVAFARSALLLWRTSALSSKGTGPLGQNESFPQTGSRQFTADKRTRSSRYPAPPRRLTVSLARSIQWVSHAVVSPRLINGDLPIAAIDLAADRQTDRHAHRNTHSSTADGMVNRLSKVEYALPASAGLFSETENSRLDVFFRKAKRRCVCHSDFFHLSAHR